MTNADCFAVSTGTSTTPCLVTVDIPNLDYALGVFLFFGVFFAVIMVFKRK